MALAVTKISNFSNALRQQGLKGEIPTSLRSRPVSKILLKAKAKYIKQNSHSDIREDSFQNEREKKSTDSPKKKGLCEDHFGWRKDMIDELNCIEAQLDKMREKNEYISRVLRKLEKRHSVTESDGVNATIHKDLIPLIEFSKEDLPSCYQHGNMYELVRALADLTVMIEVFPSQQNQSYKSFQGTGKIDDVLFRNLKTDGPCVCTKCSNSKAPSEFWGEVRIVTSTFVVRDDNQSKNSKCTLFHDDDSQSGHCFLFGSRLFSSNKEQDVCKFVCITCDKGLLEQLDRLVNKFVENWRKSFDTYVDTVKSDDEKFIFLVSHPHGRSKRVSVGRWLKDSKDKKMKFQAPTYPGTSGAFILVPTFDLIDDNLTFVHKG